MFIYHIAGFSALTLLIVSGVPPGASASDVVGQVVVAQADDADSSEQEPESDAVDDEEPDC